jgi:hypothetical protein
MREGGGLSDPTTNLLLLRHHLLLHHLLLHHLLLHHLLNGVGKQATGGDEKWKCDGTRLAENQKKRTTARKCQHPAARWHHTPTRSITSQENN